MSELQDLLNRRLQSEDPRIQQQTRVTVRLSYDQHRQLVKLAEVFKMSKTAACEDITAAAIKDAWSHYLSTLEGYELDVLYREMDQEAEQERVQAMIDEHEAALQEEKRGGQPVGAMNSSPDFFTNAKLGGGDLR